MNAAQINAVLAQFDKRTKGDAYTVAIYTDGAGPLMGEAAPFKAEDNIWMVEVPNGADRTLIGIDPAAVIAIELEG